MVQEIKIINISTETIELQQFLKLANVISSGGEAKMFIQNNNILVNDISEKRRKHKLKDLDIIEINNQKYQIHNK